MIVKLMAAALALRALLPAGLPELDAARWHMNPAGMEQPVLPLGLLAGPAGVDVDVVLPVLPAPPGAVIDRLDTLIIRMPFADRVAISPDGQGGTWAWGQRGRGIPDVISARAVERPGGTRLWLWARPAIGPWDFGENRARVADLAKWLAQDLPR